MTLNSREALDARLEGPSDVVAVSPVPAQAELLTIETLADPAALRAVIGRPAFRPAAEAFARAALSSLEAADPHTRWRIADLGRTSLYIISLALDGLPVGLTAANLKWTATTYGLASPGRVTAFVDHALKAGHLDVEPGDGVWTRRRLRPRSAFIQPLGRMLAVRMRAVASLAPELETAADRLASDAAVTEAITQGVGLITAARTRDLDWLKPLRMFMERDGGTRFIEVLLSRQREPRTRLLERVEINKSQAARACGVSRRHLDNVIADGVAAGLLAVDGAGVIEIAPPLSEAVEGYYAIQVRGFRLIARRLSVSPV